MHEARNGEFFGAKTWAILCAKLRREAAQDFYAGAKRQGKLAEFGLRKNRHIAKVLAAAGLISEQQGAAAQTEQLLRAGSGAEPA